MKIRLYTTNDYDECYKLLENSNMKYSFSEKSDRELFSDLLKSDRFLNELTFVYEKDEKIVGILMYTKCFVRKQEGVLMSLIFSDEKFLDVESELLEYGNEKSFEKGYSYICVMGEPDDFHKYGFERARDFGILCPFYVEDDYFMAKTVEGFHVRGELNYAKEFFE